ncbi:hypothetical protein POM88_035295 [Heracleum sosnowskyi]|uniref:Uncharacterized protein n=1 Tax=Heracleum sosnowskyi TaxID=360622 RepID=A0AAD8HM25_9APIA|nr:hypothetical protein POM88_035295 [Heracleum sosnowskyi]
MADINAFDIENMTLILTMGKYIANASPAAAGKIEAVFLARLVVAPLLEVNDADTADFAKRMHDRCGWIGTACIDRALDADVRADIIKHLDDVPYRMFERIAEAEVVFE